MKKIISVIAAICLLCSFSALSFADYKVPVTANISAGTFSVTVPTSITITDSTNGKQQSYQITNTGTSAVKINSITVNGYNNWNRVTGSFTGFKQFQIDFSGNNEKIPGGETGTYHYTASIPANQPSSVNEQIATVEFTIAIDDSTFTPIIPQPLTQPSRITVLSQSFYKIATYGNYTLLIMENPVAEGAYPSITNAVDANTNDSISIPVAGSPKAFDLSSTEFSKYNCENIPDTNNYVYCLRDGVFVENNTVTSNPYSSDRYHRYAIWVPTNILPVT